MEQPKEIKIPINQETCDYIQRIIFEKNNLAFIITRFFEKHINDKDASLLTDEAFLKYHKDLELVNYEYDITTRSLSVIVNNYLNSIGIYNVDQYQWFIDDFINDKYIIVKKYR